MGISAALESLLARARRSLRIALAADGQQKESPRHPNDCAALPRLTARRPNAGLPPSATRRALLDSRDPAALAALADAQALDALLDTHAVAAPSDALAQRIIASAPARSIPF
ncbi:hypothetical protein BHUM_01288 [Candidatus Burkholderia humilis]|nr:hypothetical protein BHUM_01288 [Candidatus Burkholderia humilis]